MLTIVEHYFNLNISPIKKTNLEPINSLVYTKELQLRSESKITKID